MPTSDNNLRILSAEPKSFPALGHPGEALPAVVCGRTRQSAPLRLHLLCLHIFRRAGEDVFAQSVVLRSVVDLHHLLRAVLT